MICAAAAILFMQIPIYVDQYTTTLIEARDREQPVFEENMRQALIFHQSYPAYFESLRHKGFDSDSLAIVEQTFQRYQAHDTLIQQLTIAPAWKKPFILLWNYDANTALGVDYWPGLPAWREAIVYGTAGILVCSLILWIISWPIRRWNRERSPSDNPPPSLNP